VRIAASVARQSVARASRIDMNRLQGKPNRSVRSILHAALTIFFGVAAVAMAVKFSNE
jgi:hypothetical protein